MTNYHTLPAFAYDDQRDREFYNPDLPQRVVTADVLRELIGLLLDTDDTIEIGLSQIGIDPDELGDEEIRNIAKRIRKCGVVIDGDSWHYT